MKQLSGAIQLLVESMVLQGEGRDVYEKGVGSGDSDALTNWPARETDSQGWLASEPTAISSSRLLWNVDSP